MKSILCYGDSNTWGYNPIDGSRYKKEIRWTTVLQKELGEKYDIISEGLNGRTTVWNDPIEGEYKNGKSYLMACLHSHKPIDLLIIMLGTNDLKYKFSLQAYDVVKGMETLVKLAKKSEAGIEGNSPEILVIIPPEIGPLNEKDTLFLGGEEKKQIISEQFSKILKGQCYILDSSKIIKSSEVDGIHLSEESHKILGMVVSEFIKNIIYKE